MQSKSKRPLKATEIFQEDDPISIQNYIEENLNKKIRREINPYNVKFLESKSSIYRHVHTSPSFVLDEALIPLHRSEPKGHL